MHLDIDSLTVTGESAIAKGQVRRERTPVGSKTKISKYSAIFHLAKRNGAWIIDDVELGPES